MDDSYIEIYNNSSEPVSLDNLHVGLTEAMSKPAFLAQDNPNYVYLQQVVRIPNGYELGGYESLLIACRKALDHTVNAPNSVNLENADFEVKNYDGDNNPNIKALPVLYNSTGGLTFLNIPNTGNSAVLFKTEEDITKWEALPPPDRPTNAQKFLKVDNHIIIDGVEILNYKTTGVDPQLKRLNNSIDATYTHITGGSYSNEACERRVESVIEVDGKKYYKLMDTNNSLKDFALTKSDIRPRVYDKPELLTNH